MSVCGGHERRDSGTVAEKKRHPSDFLMKHRDESTCMTLRTEPRLYNIHTCNLEVLHYVDDDSVVTSLTMVPDGVE